MVSELTVNSLTQVSCILSMVGSFCVGLSWYFPKSNRKKRGRILLFWLSISDFISSLVYLLQTFSLNNGNDTFCQITALLGIFFPVASFLWTDFIAYYLYLVVKYRTNIQSIYWKRLLKGFHIVCWTTCLIIVIFVFSFGHAGSNDDDSNTESRYSNTGGWCWIRAEDRIDLFTWELIGGKLIEWSSCLILLPYFYSYVVFKLRTIDKSTLRSVDSSSSKLALSDNLRNYSNESAIYTNSSANMANSKINALRSSEEEIYSHMENESPNVLKMNENNSSNQSSQANPIQERISNKPNERPSSRSFSTNIFSSEYDLSMATSNPSMIGRMPNQATSRNFNAIIRKDSSTQSIQLFSRFYTKLAALPLVFFFIRFWGSIRVILEVANSPAADNAFLVGMNAFFDPSQGFFNSLLFVLTSEQDRKETYIALKYLGRRILFSLYLVPDMGEFNDEDSSEHSNSRPPHLSSTNPQYNMQNFVGTSITPMPDGRSVLSESLISNPLQNYSVSEVSFVLDDISEDFECDEHNRLSGFSFDSNMDNLKK